MRSIAANSELDLLQRIARGDEIAYARIYQDYKSRVFSIAYHLVKSPYLAEEVTQEVFVNIWISRNRLAQVQNLGGYLYTSTYHKALQTLKQERHHDEIMAWTLEQPDSDRNIEDGLILKETELSLHQAALLLPKQKRLIFTLSKKEGLTNKEIAERLHLAPNTVKNHLGEAVKILKSFLKNLPLFLHL